VRVRRPFLLVLISFTAVLGSGCTAPTTTTTGADGSGSTGPGATVERGATVAPAGPATGSITVSAAASLTAVFKTVRDGFKAANPGVGDVVFNFDSSSALVTQIQHGAPVDGVATADDVTMTKLTDAELVAGAPVVFARNRLTIVVKKGNPKGIRTLADLRSAGTIALCGARVPCGSYADQILDRANVSIPTDKVTRGQNASGTFHAVADGDADAAIVYVTDVTGDRTEAVAIPDAQNVVATYPFAVVKAAHNPATAEAFLAYLLSPPGQASLQAAGFLPPT
jgi:molybdate transport system substrate-binding protein